jgi:hypothetical protein
VRISQFIFASEITALNSLFSDFWKNDLVNYEGVISAFGGSLQLLPSGAKDFTLVEADPVLVSSITLSSAENAISLASNGQLQLTALVSPSNADVTDVIWSSSNDLVATVSSAGLVSGVTSGNVTITATSAEPESLVSSSIELTLTDPIVLASLEVTTTRSTIGISGLGATTQLTVNPTPLAWVGDYSFSSSNENVATVGSTGLVTGLIVGTTTITATSIENPTISNTISITVENMSYASDLIISEVYEGASNNKYLEIFNGTGITIALSNYSVGIYSNGGTSTTPVAFPAGSSLAHGETFIFFNGSINATLFPELALIPDSRKLSSNVTFYNGDDALALFKNSTVIDVFGTIGFDPGASWALSGGGTTLDHSVTRKSSIKSPFVSLTNTWDDTQWTATAVTATTGGGGTLGTHVMTY